MKKQVLIIVLCLCSAFLFCENIDIFPENPVPGSVIFINEGTMGCLEGCTLFDSEGETAVAESSPVLSLDGSSVYILPLSHTVKPGTYVLRLYYAGVRHRDVDVEIGFREFRSDDVHLNSDMTRLRTEEDRQKEKEAAELWKLLGSRDYSLPFRDIEFIKPVEEIAITSFYGDRRRYIYSNNSTSRTYHNGIDYAVYTGTPVKAAESGRVVMAKYRLISGYTVIIEHMPGMFTLYYHLDSLDVSEGDVVSRDTTIGKSGATGLATGPHLHYEMRVFQVPVDPEFFFSRISPHSAFD